MEHNSPVFFPSLINENIMRSMEALGRASFPHGIVRAATSLRKDASTEVLNVHQLAANTVSTLQYVEIAEDAGRLYCVGGLISPLTWIKTITFSGDHESCNVMLKTAKGGIVMKTVRHIVPGEPLFLWFSEDVKALLNIPFLTPSHIQGQNQYICHLCHACFECPNPLKLHMALSCGRVESSHLWTILAKEFDAPRPKPIPFILPPTNFNFTLTPPPPTSTVASPILVETSLTNGSPSGSSSSNQPSPSSSHISPISSPARTSAFEPYQSHSFPSFGNSIQQQSSSVSLRADVHAAQMETIVSNLGKSKQGHLCVYCGKVYSRKYGLKIHIRTHTGYKPLRCKHCGRPFGDPSNLNKHVRLHADENTPYKCELCGKILVRRRDLERHLKSRHQKTDGQSSDTSSDDVDV